MDKEDIFEDIYRKYASNIQRVCYLYLGNIAASEDAMQETFLKAFEGYQRFLGNSDVKTWLTRIAINTCKDMLRKEVRKNQFISGQICQDMVNSEYTMEHAINKIMISEAIQNLPIKLREVVILFYYQEFSTKVISVVLHIPRTTVEFRLKKARKEMAKQIEKETFYG